MTPWQFLRYLVLPLAVVTSNQAGGWWNFLVPFIFFLLHPVLGFFTRHLPEENKEEKNGGYSPAYRFVALFFVPVLLGVTAWSVLLIGTRPFSWISFTGLLLSTGIMNGVIGFTLAHEFIHRKNKWDRLAGHALLLQQNYLHYRIEHIGGHHVYACTPEDPHTARLNESFYQFLPRAVAGTFRNAWTIEKRRLSRYAYPVWCFQNRMLQFLMLHLFVCAGICATAGWPALLFFIGQSGVAIGLLHVTNYLQHYGLLREQPEKISPHHAWKSRKGKDGLNLFQVENHADHHMHPGRSYEKLERHEDSPEMPTGYTGMILLAFLPPLWFRLMNKRIHLFTT